MTKETVKPLSEQPKGFKYKYKRLYDLGSERMAIIDQMLSDGISTMKVAEKIKDEWGECSGVKIVTLDKQVYRYRKEILEPKLEYVRQMSDREGISQSDAMKKFMTQVDVMDRLNMLINMQTVRIQRAFAKEDKNNKAGKGKLDPTINKELRPLTDMCRVLAGLQLETGVVRRVPKVVQGFFQNLSTNELQEFRLEMTQNDETLKVLGELKDVIQEATGEIIDGEYVSLESELTQLPAQNAEAVEPGTQ